VVLVQEVGPAAQFAGGTGEDRATLGKDGAAVGRAH